MSAFGHDCTLCERAPAMGNSSITSERDGVAYPFCHPVVAEQRDGWSCMEIVGYVMVENNPRGRRPPTPLPPVLAARARTFIAAHRRTA